VLDASVAVAALRPTEALHADALRRCLPLFAGRDEIVVPSLFDVEVTSALVRRGVAAASVDRWLATQFVSRKLIVLGPRAAQAARRIVGLTKLRAADAIYVWVAVRENLPLVTADGGILSRAPLAGAIALPP
jgi:predicted nucleic acid-binding protein